MEHNFTLDELNAKRLEIEAQIEAVRLEQKDKAIAQIKDIITANNIKAADFGSVLADLGVVWTEVKDKKPRKVRIELQPKYRGPNGELWSGRGRKPNWLMTQLASGATLEQFAV